MKNLLNCLLFAGTGVVQAAGFYELDYDWNRPGRQVTTITIGSSVGLFTPMLVADSTGYYEGFVGYSMKLRPVSITTHLGLEGLKGVNPKARGLIVASTKLGPLSAMTVSEFGGVTGNFHKERLWFDAGQYSLGLVHHRFAGLGSRVDYRLDGRTTIYLQYLQKSSSSRLTLAVAGTF